MELNQMDSATGRGRFFRLLAESLVQLDRQAGQLTDQAGAALLGETPGRRDRGTADGLVEGLFGGRGGARD
jgi:hypothetical protein